MITPRRAARANGRLAVALRIVSAILTGSLVTLGVASAFVAGRLARRVVTPAARVADTRILSLDTAAQTITLSRTDDTSLPGRYGLFTSGTESYLKLGTVLAQSDTAVTRKLLTHIDGNAWLDAEAAFSGWYFDRPEQLQIPFTNELIGTSIGPCPAWLFPAEGDAGDDAAVDTGRWVIQIHGRGSARSEALRAVPLFRGLGYTSLVVSYRNDGEAPRSKRGTYTLGATEWRDVDAAVSFAIRRGAREIVLMGWSMGGQIALQLDLNSAHREKIVGLILESPAIDWSEVLHYQAALLHVPKPVISFALGALSSDWGAPVRGPGERIPLDRLDIVSRAAELKHPILVLHSDQDGFVPSGGSHALALARPDLVTLEVFDTARHTKLWNYDQERWSRAITDWVEALDVRSAAAAGS
jgi:alpha-beta hydrolase superfamily lysophospholipase